MVLTAGGRGHALDCLRCVCGYAGETEELAGASGEGAAGAQGRHHCDNSSFCPFQVAQRKGRKAPPSLDPEVLSVFVPPFVSKEESQPAGASGTILSKPRRRSFRKKREKPRAEPAKGPAEGPRGPDPDDVSVPNGVDLLALPQLCFPGTLFPGDGCAGGHTRDLCPDTHARRSACLEESPRVPQGPSRAVLVLGVSELKGRLARSPSFGTQPAEETGCGAAEVHVLFIMLPEAWRMGQ